MRRYLFLSWFVGGSIFASRAWSAEPITTASLLEEMIDMKRLAEFPEPFFRTVQFSSYDRRSTQPGGPFWFANNDGFGGEPIPAFEAVLKPAEDRAPGEYLICDVKGPGAIVRVWTARISGSVRLTLDDADQPVYDGPAEPFFLSTYAALKVPGVEAGVFERTFAQLNAAYCPIPFAKRCRLVWRGNPRTTHFYQVQVRQYEAGAQVSTFQPQDLKTHGETLRRVAGVLADPRKAWRYASGREPVAISAKVGPGEQTEALKLVGPAALERLTLKVSAGDLDRALRQTILHVFCDDYPHGHVQAPVGDFFGAAPGINPYDSVPFTVEPDGTMTCRYVMPFARSLRIVLDNRGRQAVEVSGSALPMDYAWSDERSMHFRARWRVNHDVTGSNVVVQDMPFLVANGAGVYVGTALMLLNPAAGTHPSGSWWGEGDEKIFVDADVRPSTFGTGSEDYFNYAWSMPDIFAYPYFAQPRDDGPANRGFVTNNRWHVLDRLPFRQRVSFYMELFCHGTVPGMSYARIGYHYARPGLMDDHVLITDEDVRHLELPADWQPIAFRGSANSVFWQAEELLADKAAAGLGHVKHNLWAGGQMLTWKPARGGDTLSFKVPVAQAGRYALHIVAALTPDSGRISATVDGKPAGFGGQAGVIDLAVPHRILSRVFDSGNLELPAGSCTLTLRYEDEPGKTIGIDFIYLQKR
ncbi:MAG: DUF2961 domain-containing protein [Phycisphaerae bacterium]|jgi:hypothetical protein